LIGCPYNNLIRCFISERLGEGYEKGLTFFGNGRAYLNIEKLFSKHWRTVVNGDS